MSEKYATQRFAAWKSALFGYKEASNRHGDSKFGFSGVDLGYVAIFRPTSEKKPSFHHQFGSKSTFAKFLVHLLI